MTMMLQRTRLVRARLHHLQVAATVATASLCLTACDGLTSKADPTTLDLLRAGSDQLCIAPDVRETLRRVIVPKPADVKAGTDPAQRLAAIKTVSLAYEMTTLQSFDKAVAKATCRTKMLIRGAGEREGTFVVDYAVSPAAEDGAMFVVTADSDDAGAFARGLVTAAIDDSATRAAAAAEQARVARLPKITAAWLVGAWSSIDIRKDGNACDTDSLVGFDKDGTYGDGAGHGRFRTDGQTITYYGRVLVDQSEDTEDRSQFDQPLVTNVVALDDRSFSENGDAWYRCPAR